ncbi:MAG: hypothetical protein PHY28_08835 [Dehalococcoidales bacterium]|nr:hypothetical protein [Dehalococcoidales bacterium]
MDIQWIIVAKAYKLKDEFLSIDEIVNQFTIHNGNKALIYLIMKANFSATETLSHKIITIKIKHDRLGELKSYDIKYKVPELNTLVNMNTYLIYQLFLGFEYIGRYIFTVSVDGDYKNEESINVIRKELDNERVKDN